MSGSPPLNQQPPVTVAYQHWLDDAANMGLMLFRMRNDSKRERIQTQWPSSPPPQRAPQSPTGPPTTPVRTSAPPPPPLARPTSHGRSSGRHAREDVAPPIPDNVTPRTGRALQTPTVATTHSSRDTASTRPPSFYLPLDP